MTIDELITKIETEQASGDFTLQAVFDRNIGYIEQIKSEGYTYKVIHEKLHNGLHIKHFRGLIRIAKSKAEIKTSPLTTSGKPKKLIENEQALPIKKITPMNNGILNQSVNEWYQETGITLSPELAERIENNGLNSNDVNDLNLTTKQKLINYLAKLENQSKYK